jgi:hypothetical protein
MDLSYYKQLLSIFSVQPVISDLNAGDIVSCGWPLLIIRIYDCTENTVKAQLTDSIETISVLFSTKEDVDKIINIGEGQVIFLYDSKVFNSDDQKKYIQAGRFYTLKEVDDGLPDHYQKEQRKDNSVRTIKIKRPSAPVKNKTLKKNLEQGSHWRTLSERWENQGKS